MNDDVTVPQLIVNADDYGRSAEVNAAIERACLGGIVTSTTVMVNMPAAAEVQSLVRRVPKISVGLHVNLTEGPPVLSPKVVPSLVNASGEFCGWHTFVRRLLVGRIRFEHVRAEITAQVDVLNRLIGAFTHFDSHQHTHVFPQVTDSIVYVTRNRPSPHRIRTNTRLFISAGPSNRSSAAMQIQHCIRHPQSIGGLVLKTLQRTRIRTAGFASPDYLLTPTPSILVPQACTVGQWGNVLSRLPRATIEMNCHPGMTVGEEAVLCDSEIRGIISRFARLVSFVAITSERASSQINAYPK